MGVFSTGAVLHVMLMLMLMLKLMCYSYIHFLGSYLLPMLMTFAWLAAMGIATHNLVYDRQSGQEEVRQSGPSSGWPFICLVLDRCGPSEWSFLHRGGLLSRWSRIRVVSHQDFLSSGWSVIRLVFHQGGFTFIGPSWWSLSGWSLIRVVFSCGWSLISLVCHPGSLSSGWSFIMVVPHQGFCCRQDSDYPC